MAITDVWTNMSKKEKIAVVVVGVGVAGFALYERSKANQQNQQASQTPASDNSFDNGQQADNNGVPLNPTGPDMMPLPPGPSGIHDTSPPVTPPPVSPPVSPPPGPGRQPQEEFYTVKKGDTLSGIARKFHETLKQIEALNPQIKNPNKIYPGEKVRVK